MQEVCEKALEELRQAKAELKPGYWVYDETVANQDEVLARFQPLFSPEGVRSLNREDVQSFLRSENNCHWSGLHRMAGKITQDMDERQAGLSTLLDDDRPLAERFDEAFRQLMGWVPPLRQQFSWLRIPIATASGTPLLRRR